MREHLLIWYRDLFLGSCFGIGLLFASFNALHWSEFRSHLTAQTSVLAIVLSLALISPRRILTIFIGLCFPLCRFIFLVFLVENIWAAIGVLLWAVSFAILAVLLGRRYSNPDIGMPEGKDTVGFVVVMGIAAGFVYGVRKAAGL